MKKVRFFLKQRIFKDFEIGSFKVIWYLFYPEVNEYLHNFNGLLKSIPIHNNRNSGINSLK